MPSEIDRFARLASQWWDADGKFRMLHRIKPARLAFLRDEMVRHFAPSGTGLRPLVGLRVLDVGCGGGLIAEPLARLGARVTGLDPVPEAIEAARRHAAGQGLDIDYRAGRVEELAAEAAAFDAVVCLEVIEHVPDVAAFLKTCAGLVRPGGQMLLSTLNRTHQGLSAGHHRRRVHPALAAGRLAPVGAVRDARRAGPASAGCGARGTCGQGARLQPAGG